VMAHVLAAARLLRRQHRQRCSKAAAVPAIGRAGIEDAPTRSAEYGVASSRSSAAPCLRRFLATDPAASPVRGFEHPMFRPAHLGGRRCSSPGWHDLDHAGQLQKIATALGGVAARLMRVSISLRLARPTGPRRAPM